MTIEYLGHSCFKLTESTGTSIVCDPYSEEMVGYSMPEVQADAINCFASSQATTTAWGTSKVRTWLSIRKAVSTCPAWKLTL